MRILFGVFFAAIFCFSNQSRAENEFKKIGKAIVKAVTDSSDTEKEATDESELKIYKPESSSELVYEFDISPRDIYPSVIVTMTDLSRRMLEKARKPNQLGGYNMAFDLKAKAKEDNTIVTVKVFPNSLISTETEETFTLSKKLTVYDITPNIAWDFDKLTALKQPKNETFKIEINVKNKNKEYKISKILQPRVRSINDALIWAKNSAGKVNIVSMFTFPGFVNENHPVIDNILKETKDLLIAAGNNSISFGAIESGASAPIDQAAALWFYFQAKNIIYSSVTTQSAESDDSFSQSIRSIEDSLNATQANCVDGSVLFASVLRKIGIEPILVSKPGHMYLMFFNDVAKKEPIFLETTMLGTYRVRFQKKLLGGTNIKKELANSMASFNQAHLHAAQVFANDSSNYQNKVFGYNLIPVGEMRKIGVSTIGR